MFPAIACRISSTVGSGRTASFHVSVQAGVLLSLQHLRHGLSTDRSLNRVLHVRHVDAIARGLRSIHLELQVRLPNHTKQSQVLDAVQSAESDGR